jgi:hypothetical protein
MIGRYNFLIILSLTLSSHFLYAQNQRTGIYVDKKGIIRWEKDDKEASFFGVNYTAPFAYGYKSIQKMNVTVEQAIKDDVYHFSRLNLDAFRVHVWDTEISDKEGNLLDNEHLRLFDFLIAELKKRDIKIMITPIAFWGNGYPEKDVDLGGFSSFYGKEKALTEEAALVAQERYLKQFFKHKNKYTGLTYGQDPDIVATEVNNEPHHTGAEERATEYINRMVKSIRGTGWSKPIFYNISESPTYAAAVVKADVQGHSFQWYPTGLVAGHTLKGNFLPNVAKYVIPFDSIPGFKTRAKVVYEFDAGDVLKPYMYPAMARSFKSAGFQWATQFAYDPMATAYANTEYQTHYLNLAYTPSKAISLLIASNVFHKLPMYDSKGTATTFDVFNINTTTDLSEMNTSESFYYTNTTQTKPRNNRAIKHIAGVGSSTLIDYEGTGAYFVDKVSEGIWRLEVMPNVAQIRDPFEKASPTKEVTRLSWEEMMMTVNLPDLEVDFSFKGMNKENQLTGNAAGRLIHVVPGVYLLSSKGKKHSLTAESQFGKIKIGEYVAPKAVVTPPFVRHEPAKQIAEHLPFEVKTVIAGVSDADTVNLRLKNSLGKWGTIPFKKQRGALYSAAVPAEMIVSGVLKYNISIRQKDGTYINFPGNLEGDPSAWNYFNDSTYETLVVPAQSGLELFNPRRDEKNLMVYNPDWKNYTIRYIASGNGSDLTFQAIMDKVSTSGMMGWQLDLTELLSYNVSELARFKSIVLKARSAGAKAAKVKLGIITDHSSFFSSEVLVGQNVTEILIPITELKRDAQLLLPRPYPGFQPLHFQSKGTEPFQIKNAVKLEVTFGTGVEIYSIYLK